MKTILTCCFVAVTVIANAQTIIFKWAKSFVGQTIAADEGLSIAQDLSGNIIVSGAMRSDIDFDPGPGSYVLNQFSAEDIFITKLDPAGNFLWAKQIVANGWDEAHAVATDAAGNVYVTGRFHNLDPVDFDPGPGVFFLTSSTPTPESYVLKLDPAGNFLWAQKIGGDGGDYGFGIAIDGNGDILLGGAFQATVDFDPGAGVFNLTPAGGQSVYVLKLDASGNFIWARDLGSASFCYGLTLDNSNNVITCGYFSGVGDFDPGAAVFNLTSAGNTDMFISKLDANGNFVWAKSIGGPVNDAAYGALATDAAGNVFMATPFKGTLDIDPGPAVFNITSNGGNYDAMLVKLTAAGDFVWGKKWGATGNDEAYALDTDASGNVYVGGSCSGTVDFDPGAGTFFLNGGSGDGCIVKFDNAGTFLTAARTVGNGGSTILSMLITPANEILSTGLFGATCDFNPGAGVFNISAPNGSDVFINKLSQGALPLTLLDFSGEAQRNGNLLQWKTVQEINTKDFEIEWSYDGQHFEKIATQQSVGNSSTTIPYSYLHTLRVNGDNYYRLKMQDVDGRFTYSNIIKINAKITVAHFSVFPNPVSDVLHLDIQAVEAATILFRLHSADGKIIASQYFSIVKGANRFNWNLKLVPSGKYFISCGSKQFKPLSIVKQ